jgi:hypothetical protein
LKFSDSQPLFITHVCISLYSVLTQLIKDSLNLKCYKVPNIKSIKISQLVDDTTLFCNSKEDVLKAINEIEIFGSFSGLLLNRNKTQPLFITHVCISLYSVLTQLIKDSLNLKCFKVPNIKSHSKESKAVEKSINIIAPSITMRSVLLIHNVLVSYLCCLKRGII